MECYDFKNKNKDSNQKKTKKNKEGLSPPKTQGALKPRKKFSLIDEARKQASSQSRAGEWVFIPRKDVLKRIQNDYFNQNLYAKGNNMELIDLTLPELLKYITILPYPHVKEESKGRKMRSIPLFYGCHVYSGLKNYALAIKQQNWKPNNIHTTQDMVDLYNQCELEHKEKEKHHPDSSTFLSTVEDSFEAIIDIYSSLLRVKNVEDAYALLLKLLASPKFEKLNPSGVYFALMHILIRGVANSAEFQRSAEWRGSRSQDELWWLNNSYISGGDFSGDITLKYEYMDELNLHSFSVRGEMIRVRQNATHDITKFTKRMIYAYSWYWGVFQQLSDCNKHRALSGCQDPAPTIFNGVETMFSFGKSFAEGMASSPAVDDTLAKVSETIKESVSEAVSQEREAFAEQAQELVNDITKQAENISEHSLSRMERLIGKLNVSLDSALDAFESMKSIIHGFFSQVVDNVKKIADFATFDVSPDTIYLALRDYILYINVTSKPLKIILMISILKNLGLLTVGFHYLSSIMDYLNSANVGVETAGSSFGSVGNLIYSVGGIFASVVKGSVLTVTEFWELVKKLSGPMKHLHFIGSGCMGITRIITFARQCYDHLLEWVQEKFFNREPSHKALARNIIIWAAKVNWLSSESGLNAIRLNQNVRKQASTLYSDYITYLAKCQEDPKLSKYKLDLHRMKREVTIIHDYIARLEAMSSFCPTMFHIQFVGKAGVGKSFLTKTFCQNVRETLWPELERDSIYSYNTNLDHFDGYAGQKIFVIDDCFRMQEPKHLTTLIGLVTNTPVILPMAHLETKGTQLTSDVLVTSTNTPWPIGKDVLCMEAVHRRRHMLVEVECDPDVRDESTGQFSKTLYLKKYAEEDLSSFPHLKFNLLRPVPSNTSNSSYYLQGKNEFTELQDYARKLKEANVKIISPRSTNLDPEFYFSENNLPPEPIQLPCTGWSYEQLVHNFAVRYRSFRGMEQTYSTEEKYAQIEHNILEMEAIQHLHSEIEEADFVPKGPDDISPLVRKWFTDVDVPFGRSDDIGKRVSEGFTVPSLESYNLDDVISELLDAGQETVLTLDEEKRRTEIIRLRRRKPVADYNLENRLKVYTDWSKGSQRILMPINSHATQWDQYGIEGWNSKRDLKSLESDNYIRFLKDMYTFANQYYAPRPCPGSGKAFLKDFWKVSNEVLKFTHSTEAHIPRDPIFGDRAGKLSGIPLYFLQHLEYDEKHSRWELDVTSLAPLNLTDISPAISVRVTREKDSYDIPLDLSIPLSASQTFRLAMLEFENFTCEQQRVLVREAKWRNNYTGLYTLEHLRESCSSFIAKAPLYALEFFTKPFAYILDKAPVLISWAYKTMIFGVIAYMLYSLGKILTGGEETSKYLHRGPPSGIIHHGRLTSADASHNDQFLKKFAQRNARLCEVSDEEGHRVSCQAFLTGRYAILPKHVLRSMGNYITIGFCVPGTREMLKYGLHRKNFVESDKSDLCVVSSTSFPQVIDLTRHFMSEKELSTYEFPPDLSFIARDQQECYIENRSFLQLKTEVRLRLPDGSLASADRIIIVNGSTAVGRSGSAVMSFQHSSTPKIVGIQIWAMSLAFAPEIAVQVISREHLSELIERCKLACGFMPERVEQELDEVSVLDGAFTSCEYNQILGKADSILGKIGRSQFKPTPIAPFMEIDGFASQRCPAALSPYDHRLVNKEHPLRHSISKYVRGTVEVMDSKNRSTAKLWLQNLISTKIDKHTFRVLDFAETISGTREDGSNPMDLNSSPGIPFIFEFRRAKGKREWFEFSEEGNVILKDPDIVERFLEFEQQLIQGKIPLYPAYDFPKDELRPISKALGSDDSPPKTRTVTCMSMFYSLAWRRHTLDFWAAMHRAADGRFPFCPGLNPEGPEWNSAYHYLNRHPNVVDFDVSNWDGLLTSDVLMDIGEIISAFHPAEDSKRVIMAILFEISNSHIQYGSTIYQKFRGMVSGFPGTAEVNTLSHWFLVLYFYLRLAPVGSQWRNMEVFCANVSMLIYGDDIVISFSDNVAPWFNGKSIADEYRSFGYVITDASKTQDIRFSKSILQCSFLKSSWRELLPAIHVRKLDETVAYDLLFWNRSKADPEDQFYSGCIDALRIMFGHGKERYDAFLLQLNKWLKKAKMKPILYLYDDFFHDHLNKYYNIDI